MTDLEICKRIAEIEKIHVSNVDAGMYDPLTDKVLCFDLMVKHEINLTSMDSVYDCGRIEREYICFQQGAYPLNVANTLSTDADPQRAICLAIINKDNKQ